MDATEAALGPFPCLVAGRGPALVYLAGLSPDVGVHNRAMRGPRLRLVAPFRDRRRVFYVNRRAGLPRGLTMAALAAEHAEAIRESFTPPVDVLGLSTGGSIAQQLAADHPDVVHRLVLVSSACRLGGDARLLQRRVAARIRGGAYRQALALLTSDQVPPGRGQLAAGGLAWLLGPRPFASAAELRDMATTIEAEDGFDLARCRRPVKGPTLIVAGADDRFYSRALFEETAKLIPDSSLMLLPGRGHVTVLLDRAYAPSVSGFLDDAGAPRPGRRFCS